MAQGLDVFISAERYPDQVRKSLGAAGVSVGVGVWAGSVCFFVTPTFPPLPPPTPTQFDNKRHRNLVRASHADDPAPLVPVNARPAFGEDINVTSVTMVLSVKRLSLFYGVSIILPVVVCTLIAFLVLFIDPDRIDTRLQICITLFLALVAVQW